MKKYYHGTSHYSAYRILNEGFRILKYYGSSGVKGTGIYVTDSLEYACDMASGKSSNENGSCFIECELKTTSPIFWTDKEYDPKVVKYLKKEFSKKIDNPDCDIKKNIPKNKKLTKKEVINLVNYWKIKEDKKTERLRNRKPYAWPSWKGDSSYLENVRFLLSRHNFSGWGQYTHDCWDSDEVVVFNPSEVVPTKVWGISSDYNEKSLFYENVKIGKELTLAELKIGYDFEKELMIKEDEKYDDNLATDMYK